MTAPDLNQAKNYERIRVAMTNLSRAIERLHATGVISAHSDVKLERALHPVVAAVAERGGARVGTIAEDVGVLTSTASRYVSALAERGLVERFSEPQDKRATYVELTEAGKRTSSVLVDAWGQILAEATESWPQDQIEQFATLFETFAVDVRTLATDRDSPRV